MFSLSVFCLILFSRYFRSSLIENAGFFSLLNCIEEDANLLGHLLFVGSKIAKSKNLTNWRTVINTGAESGQTVFHLHIHFLSGRKMNWPPG